jgi:hypothetical protein
MWVGSSAACDHVSLARLTCSSQILSACDIHVPADKLAIVIAHYHNELSDSNGQELTGVIQGVLGLPAPAGNSRRASVSASSSPAASPSAPAPNVTAPTTPDGGHAQSPASSQNTATSMQMNVARLLRVGAGAGYGWAQATAGLGNRSCKWRGKQCMHGMEWGDWQASCRGSTQAAAQAQGRGLLPRSAPFHAVTAPLCYLLLCRTWTEQP